MHWSPCSGRLEVGAIYWTALALTRELVQEFAEATPIVRFFDTWEEVKRIERLLNASGCSMQAMAQRIRDAGHRNRPVTPTAAEPPAADDHRPPLSRWRWGAGGSVR